MFTQLRWVRNICISPSFPHNSWVTLIYTKEINKAPGKIALVHCEHISDVYEGHLTIRKVEVAEKDVQGKLFAEKEINLVALNASVETIKIGNIISGDEVEIVGLEYQLPET
jgi:hypothetical protein